MAKLLKIDNCDECCNYGFDETSAREDFDCDLLDHLVPAKGIHPDCPLQDAPKWTYLPEYPQKDGLVWVYASNAGRCNRVVKATYLYHNSAFYSDLNEMTDCFVIIIAWMHRTIPEPPEIDRKDI